MYLIRVYYELTNDQLPAVGLIALQQYRRGHEFESRSSLNFSVSFFTQLLKTMVFHLFSLTVNNATTSLPAKVMSK